MNGHGGARQGAGRPQGTVGVKTAAARTLFCAMLAQEARRLWKANGRKKDDEPSAQDVEASYKHILDLKMETYNAASQTGQYGVALGVLNSIEDRSFGRVKFQMEVGEDEDSGPVRVMIEHFDAYNNDQSSAPSSRTTGTRSNRRSVKGNGRHPRS